MRNKFFKEGIKAQQREGWDMLLKNYEMKQRQEARPMSTQRRISFGIGHHLARMMKGHI